MGYWYSLKPLLVAYINHFTIILSYPIFAGLGVWDWEFVNLASVIAPGALLQL